MNTQNDPTNVDSLIDDDLVIDSNVGSDCNIDQLSFTLNEDSAKTNVSAKKEAMLKHPLIKNLKCDNLYRRDGRKRPFKTEEQSSYNDRYLS